MALSNVYLAKHTGKEIDEGIDKISGLETDINGKYTKPESGIPKTDLSAEVQASLTNADNAMPKTGGDFSGAVTVQAPTADNNPATKKYVDDANAGLVGTDESAADTDTIKGAKAYAKSLDTAMDTRMDAAETKLTTLTGAATVEGSVAKALADAKAYTDEEIGKIEGTDTTYTFAEGTTNGAFVVTPEGGDAQIVPIHGLGSAAYTDSSAYDAKGTAEEKANAAKDVLIGNADTDTSASNTIAGAKKYAADEAAKKVASVGATDKSIAIGGTATAPTVGVQLDGVAGNALKLAAGGLRVDIPAADTYSIAKDENSGEYAAVYHLTKNGTENMGVAINIPKDLVVESGEVVELGAGEAGEGKPAGTYIKLVLQNQTTPLYINVTELIEYVTSGSQPNDAVQVVVDETTHKVTASIKEGSLTRAMLDSGVQTSLNLADNSVQQVAGQRLMTDEEGTKLAGIQAGAEANVIQIVKVNNTALTPDAQKAVNINVPTGTLAGKDKVAEGDLDTALGEKIAKIADLETRIAALETLLNQVGSSVMFVKADAANDKPQTK